MQQFGGMTFILATFKKLKKTVGLHLEIWQFT
jgi:hypothetical protein